MESNSLKGYSTLLIEGEFWDSRLYMGKLFLWEYNNGLIVVDWDKLIDELAEKSCNSLGFEYLFKLGYNGSYSKKKSLINPNKVELDQAVKSLEANEFIVTKKCLDKYIIAHLDNPSRVLNTDCKIYNKQVYYINEEGFFSSELSPQGFSSKEMAFGIDIPIVRTFF